MSGSRLGLPLVLYAAVACAHTPSSQAPRPLKPEQGPHATIRVDYTGGLINRTLQAYFRTESYAYVLVGHLGGDGRIRVLFPETPDESGFIRGKRSYRTAYAQAHFDGMPSLFSYTMSPYRSMSALYDSYDGRGHGYVFIIASRTPLRYGLLYDDAAGWAEWELSDYGQEYDPRYAVRSFADALTGGARYTLKFASGVTTSHYASYATRAWDCAFLNSLLFAGGRTWMGFWNYSLLGTRASVYGDCGYGDPYARYAFVHGRPIFTTTVAQVPPVKEGAPAPTLDRPGRRGLGPRAEPPSRTATLTRVAPTLRTRPFDDDAPRGRRVSPRPTFDDPVRAGTSTTAERRSRPDADRSYSPRNRGTESRSADRSAGSTRSSGSSSARSPAASGSSSRGGERSVQSPREARSSAGKKPDQQ